MRRPATPGPPAAAAEWLIWRRLFDAGEHAHLECRRSKGACRDQGQRQHRDLRTDERDAERRPELCEVRAKWVPGHRLGLSYHRNSLYQFRGILLLTKIWAVR